MATEFKLPELGEGIDSAEVARIHVQEGDEIEANQDVMELETEKAVADLPCPHAGKVAQVHVSAGDTVKVGQTVLTIEEETEQETGQEEGGEDSQEQSDEAADEQKERGEKQKKKTSEKKEKEKVQRAEKDETEEAAEPEKSEQEADEQTEKEDVAEKEETEAGDKRTNQQRRGEDKVEQEDAGEPDREAEEVSPRARRREGPPVPAGPATRRLARKLNVDMDHVDGTGPPGDRVTQEDVVRTHLVQSPDASSPPLPNFEEFGAVERRERNKIAQVTSENLSRSWRLIPHVTQHGQADITELEEARRHYNQKAAEEETDKQVAKVTLTALTAKAVVAALKEYPHFNSSLDAKTNELILKHYYHLGFAVDTEYGLFVPVIRNVEQKSIQGLAEELAELAEQAGARRLRKEQMTGGTFTISNQGGIGGTAFTPIVSWPQVAILGLSRAEVVVKMADGTPAERFYLPLSLSYDHRVINGADAARFMVRLTELLSDFQKLLIEA